MEIIRDLTPKKRTYSFIHEGCCEFIAKDDEFKWAKGQYGGIVADIICPKCGKQFYGDPEEIMDIKL